MKRYDWYKNDSLTNPGSTNSFTAPAKGRYYVVITDSKDCIDTSRTVFYNFTGLEKQQKSDYLRIYPNPTSGKLILKLGVPVSANYFLSLYNVYGKEILNQTLNAKDVQSSNEIDISDQPAGIYTIIIRFQDWNFHQLIIKE
jgi:hypothetical protein